MDVIRTPLSIWSVSPRTVCVFKFPHLALIYNNLCLYNVINVLCNLNCYTFYINSSKLFCDSRKHWILNQIIGSQNVKRLTEEFNVENHLREELCIFLTLCILLTLS